MRVRSSKMRVFSLGMLYLPYEVPHWLYTSKLNGFARFPGDSTALGLLTGRYLMRIVSGNATAGHT